MSASWEDALSLMRTALVMLDESDAPLNVGAHLDLAIVRLSDAIDAGEQGTTATVRLKAWPRAAGESEH